MTTSPRFNDASSALSLLLTRRSAKARDLVAPGPDAGQLKTIIKAALRVPDHGKLAPWRFVEIVDRDALAQLLHRNLPQIIPDAGQPVTDGLDEFVRQAPMLVAAISAPHAEHKIPVWEQQYSAGAAVQNMLLAAHAQGFACNWLSGLACDIPGVADALGAPGGRVIGWIFIGTPSRPLDERPRPDAGDVLIRWPG